MTYLSDHPVTVDGVRLDTLAWGIEAQQMRLGGLRSGDVVLAGLDGVLQSVSDPREPSALSLSMFVRGTDADGTVPAGADAVAVVRQNLDDLLHLFARTDSLLDVREVVDAGPPAIERQFVGKVLDAIEPNLEPGAVARFAVTIQNGGVYWRDTTTADWTQAAVVTGTQYQVTTLDDASAPVDDGVVVVDGPADAGVQVADASGAFVRLNTALAAGQSWRVNCGTWSSRVGALTLDSADTDGTDATADTDQGGPYPSLLRMTPQRVAGARVVRLSVVGSGFTAATSLHTRTRRAYL